MRTRTIAALGCALLATGCASIVSGVSQPVSIETRLGGEPVAGVACRLSSNKGTWFVTTPGQVTLHRGYQDMAIECAKPGLTPSISTAASHVRPIFFGNLLFGGLIGILVDLGDGAAFDYDDLISVDLGAKPVAIEGMVAPIGQPPVSTAVVTVAPIPSTTTPSIASPIAPAPGAAATAPPAPAAVVAPKPAFVRNEWRYQFAAEALAKSSSCAARPVATLTSVGPGSETYLIPCTSGEPMIARCEYGNCRALR